MNLLDIELGVCNDGSPAAAAAAAAAAADVAAADADAAAAAAALCRFRLEPPSCSGPSSCCRLFCLNSEAAAFFFLNAECCVASSSPFGPGELRSMLRLFLSC